jgi:hydroxyacylglutathione hydrolase
MEVTSFLSGPADTNAYIISNGSFAFIIDPAPGSAPRIQKHIETKQLTVSHILLTHSHWDHTADVAPLKELYQVPVGIHPDDQGNLIAPGSDGLPCWFDIPSVKPDFFLNDGDSIELEGAEFSVIHTPGHSPGGICLYCKEKETLVSGDTLFHQSIGNLSFPTSDPKKMWESLKKLEVLPPSTRVYPGHGPATTIGAETWLKDAERIFG